MTIQVTVAMKSIEQDRVIEVEHILNATHLKSRIAHLLLYSDLFSGWQFASWQWQGQAHYLFKEESACGS